MTLTKGALVRHDTLGLGKVVGIDEKFAHVLRLEAPGGGRAWPTRDALW
jgi:hypothetical protein